MLGAIAHGLWKGTKVVATGKTQSSLGAQSPQLPGAIVRLGRAFYSFTGIWVTAVWYTGYVNMRTEPGSGPKLILPGQKVVNSPDRPGPQAAWSTPKGGGGPGGVSAAPGGAAGQATSLPGGGVAGGFLPKGAMYKPGRADQGRDGQTNPGGAIIAPGAGTVLSVKSDPGGFGPAYPVVKFSSGPYAGRTIYIGHTISVLRPGQAFKPNQVLSHTGTSGVGNATVPGWFEIGYADSGSPGRFGQPTPF